MRFIHTADLHVGGSAFLPDNLDRSEKVIRSIYKIAEENHVTTVVIAGDVFEDADTTQSQRDLVENLLLEYDSLGFTTLVIPGNHDRLDKTGSLTALRYLALLTKFGRFQHTVVVEETTYQVIDNTVFILLVHRPGHFREDLQKSLLDIPSKYDSCKVVLVAHECVAGAVTDNGFKPPKGESLTDATVTYSALGDIHVFQRIMRGAFYSGAPYQLKFGDVEEKGVLLVDTDKPNKPTFIQIESKKFVTVTKVEDAPEDAYVKLITSDVDIISNELPENVVKFNYVKEDELMIELDDSLSFKENLLEGVGKYLEEKQVDNKEMLLEVAENEIQQIVSIAD